MLIGTLSFSRSGNNQTLGGNEQALLIRDVLKRHSPDFLVCSGHSVLENDHLKHVEEAVAQLSNTRALVEVQNDEAAVSERRRNGNRSLHAMYIVGASGARRLGSQIFKSSSEAAGLGSYSEDDLREQFISALSDRRFTLGNHSCLAICCGEINLLFGRSRVSVRWPEAMATLLASQIIVNPTHDRMGNAGTLIAKRTYLSGGIDGRARCYISASNWNIATKSGSQSPASTTLHTIFYGGQSIPMSRKNDNTGKFEYRECRVQL